MPSKDNSKPFIIAEVRDILDPLDRDEISYSKMVEKLYNHAFEWAEKKYRFEYEQNLGKTLLEANFKNY